MLFFVALFQVTRPQFRGTRTGVLILAFMAVWLVIVGATMVLGRRMGRAGRVAAITPECVFIRDGLSSGAIKWSEVAEVTVMGRTVTIHSRLGTLRAIGAPYIFDTPEEAEEFQKAVNAARERYTRPDAGEQCTQLP